MTKGRQKEEVLIALGAKTCWCSRLATKVFIYSNRFVSYPCDEHAPVREDSAHTSGLRIVAISDL